MTADFTNLFQAGVASGAERELRRAGLQLIIVSTDDTPEREPELAHAMIDRRVSALLMMPDGDHRDFLTDDDRAVQQAAEHLLQLGHRHIAALAGRLDSFRAAQRLSGYRNALAQAGIKEDPRLVVGDLTTPEQARDVVIRPLHQPAPPTAVLALNLGISTGVLVERLAGHHAFAFIGLESCEAAADGARSGG
ncbi:substrate-binding domain-containing protein [Streptomyces sp. NPDC057002]|uniref:substrate-binding domain-containing protein n=1 Tax=Streptomyces sp. NPDC057002 TaxID=3345992 RepID=UPI00364033A2